MTQAEDRTAARLSDGSEPATPEDLFRRLADLEIAVSSVAHPPVFTVEEAKALRGDLPRAHKGAHIKNLFLRNKKGVMWLVVCLEDRAIDLKKLGEALGAGRLSFGSAARLMTHLGVAPGSVTPFAVLNDGGGAVRVALDPALKDFALVNCHPLVNSMTTAIAPEDLIRFLASEGHEPTFLDFEAL
jgi:Ala-tRNA(Pro) deacylase